MSSVPTRNPRNVHVLFVHGVGTHSPLSSLLQAYQAFRSNIRSPEAPIQYEDPIPEWDLSVLDDGNSAPHLKLTPNVAGKGATEAVYLYEVNYSALAGVIRANQPLDITRLFVGLDLAVNVARERLRWQPAYEPPTGAYDIDHGSLARTVQKLAAVFVAATVPILGIPSLIFRSYTKSYVATFTRFFEDIATFALDKNGEDLISAHVDRTVTNILDPRRFKDADAEFDRDVFVIAAHSLGTIVTHSYIVRHALANGSSLPAKILTFGSPIGIVSWLWLFLDFPTLQFDPAKPTGDNYFCWAARKKPAPISPLPPIQWINVVNYMDPIATAFPIDYVNLDQSLAENASSLIGNCLHHRFLKTGNILSAGSAHTAYFEDRTEFLEILGRLAGLRGGRPEEPAQRSAGEHWKQMIHDLSVLRYALWIAGLVSVGIYLSVIASTYRTWSPFAFFLMFAWPPITIGTLAFFQKLFFGHPTKRTSPDSIDKLRWLDKHSFPYRLRRFLKLPEPDPLAAGPGWRGKMLAWIVSFAPSLIAMLLPVYCAFWFASEGEEPLRLMWHNVVPTLAMLALFMTYFVTFAISEFVAYWRSAIKCAIST